jgi:hypothetical protein
MAIDLIDGKPNVGEGWVDRPAAKSCLVNFWEYTDLSGTSHQRQTVPFLLAKTCGFGRVLRVELRCVPMPMGWKKLDPDFRAHGWSQGWLLQRSEEKQNNMQQKEFRNSSIRVRIGKDSGPLTRLE